jgi:branched-chain amino acid transport system ATP-binding protein
MLRISNVSSGYSDLLVLRDVTLEVREGEFVALVGSNAAGKTTLMRTLSGLLRTRAGSIEFGNKRIDGLAPYERADCGLAVVLEHSVLPRLTVYENLQLGAYRRDAREHMQENLDKVFAMFPVLSERRNQIATSLSGGEQQMLCIGRALMGRPSMIALDEPSIGLSPTMVSTILKALHQLNQQGLTTFMVEQNVAQTLRVSSRAYVMENGAIVLEGGSQELLTNPAIKEAYLGL